MIKIEEYEVDPSKMDELIKLYEVSKKIFDELKLPYIKNYTVYHSIENPNKIRAVFIFNEDGNSERLKQDYRSHPKASWVIENAMKIIKNVHIDEYKELFPF